MYIIFLYTKGAYRMSTLLPPYDFSKYTCFLIKEAFVDFDNEIEFSNIINDHNFLTFQ